MCIGGVSVTSIYAVRDNASISICKSCDSIRILIRLIATGSLTTQKLDIRFCKTEKSRPVAAGIMNAS